jgi:hypothetical protein
MRRNKNVAAGVINVNICLKCMREKEHCSFNGYLERFHDSW